MVSTLTGYTAKGRVRGTAIGAYATWLQRPGHVEVAYLDASVQRGRFDNRVDGVDLPREQYDARVLNTSVEGGYTFNVWQGPHAALYVQPQLQLSHDGPSRRPACGAQWHAHRQRRQQRRQRSPGCTRVWP
ncbi:autotransporter outer membrane beta-barrel domain-containing protein [Stenotrophomonas lactitubi]|uniref:autotransporter outer membrane beta-barrel domain-containing protein n=1 Tax=Stenotrophomonas lactitubi TaxID=2045214 RepID=UPI0033404FF6